MIKILGISFFNETVNKLFDLLNKKGGLLTVPAAPALVNIPHDKAYYESLLNSDYIIADSGYMVLIWNTFFSPKVKRISGLEFVNCFIDHSNEIDGAVFTINPSEIDSIENTNYLNSIGIEKSSLSSYSAPFYKGDIQDKILLKQLEQLKPHWVLVNIGGGTQEKLGLYLKNNLSYKPAIICTGAALAFKTGRQVKVTDWMDKLFVGWFARCISNPKLYIPRYFSAFKLIGLIFKYKDKSVKIK
jgi:N-acetylglucosaminyldiphosphoundecaprenol N-acetyl-beta-D-mannosaminyltransferase